MSMVPAVPARRRRSPIWLALAAVTALMVVAVPSASARESAPLYAQLSGVFAFGPCPEDAPEGAVCLHDKVSGGLTGVGVVSGDFDVVIDAAHTRPDGV